MKQFDHIINWTLQKGSHKFPGPDGGTCINEAAVVAAGFAYKAINTAEDMPECFSRPIAQYALVLNDRMPDDQRQRLVPYILRLAGTANTLEVEQLRAQYLAMQAGTVFLPRVLDAAGFPEQASRCRGATTLSDVLAAADWAWAPARAVMRADPRTFLPRAAMRAAEAVLRAAVQAEETPDDAGWIGVPVPHGYAATNAAGAAADAAAWPPPFFAASVWAPLAQVAWDDALAALDGVLAIGLHTEPLDPPLAIERLERAKAAA